MKLSDLLEELAYGELSDLSLAVNGEIKDESKPKLVIKINDVLQSLYTKYVIKFFEVDLDTTLKSYNYTITSENAVKILYIHPNVVNEAEIYRNNDQLSIRGNTVSFIKHPIANSFRVSYQWRPSKLKINPSITNFGNQQVDISPELLPLVKLLVASAIYTNMNGETHKKTGVDLFNQAQILQADLELTGVLNISVDFKNNQFRLNGFT